MIASLDADAVAAALTRTDLPPDVRRVLELRALTASASVKKAYAMEHQACRDDRLRNLIVHHGARTGRPTGEGPQPLNLPKAGPKLAWCEACARPALPRPLCPWCGALGWADRRAEWTPTMIPHVLEIMAARDHRLVERFFGDALLAISGCVRGLFVSAPGYDLIASDYASIEAVVLAYLAGEQWRMDVLSAKADLYLYSVAKTRGATVQMYLDYKAQHDSAHPDRIIGKIMELSLGFQGWLGALRAMEVQYSVDLGMTDDEIKPLIVAWRAASPTIVEYWGGQWRGPPWRRERAELFGVEGHTVAALQSPGVPYVFRGIRFLYDQVRDVLTLTLLSGRALTYHSPRLAQSDRNADELSISYSTHNSNPKYGQIGWVRMSTWGGRLTENIVQATAHDVLRFAIINLRAAGYPTVLHVYDEILVEVPEGLGSVKEVEQIMGVMPAWAAGWPIRAEGGWRHKRYRKG